MIHFLRNQNNQTIIEAEAWDKDFHTSIDLIIYSNELLSLESLDLQKEWVMNIYYAYDLREIYWNLTQQEEPLEEYVAKHYKELAAKWNLIYTVD